ncbi:hypothetical protein ABID22_002610 [Pontibacter aydingkolensis]|uniref:T9SS type A sorting domain-containing protein n=1 Tax=Pontibacter aydingkolensis TaxID=1911536 RepID=A0ABS7CWQ6_9BACT|nr:PKD-like domain-containing protein [Pontibacter aydingkolensis]MBW7468208.1 T9SS type A sorting domain-containing protein [Pontibacter aydingkolensis]
MKKYFTQLIAKSSSLKRYSVAIFTLLLVTLSTAYLMADVAAITVQNLSVSADKAQGGPSADFTTLQPVIIQESDQKDFKLGSGSLVLNAPEGWVFRQSGVTVSITHQGGGTTPNVSTTGSIVYSANTLSIPITVSGENRIDRLVIDGLALQAVSGTELLARAVTLSVSGTTVAGLPSPTTVANISQIYGSARDLVFTQQPTSTTTYTTLSTVAVAVRDWAGNTVRNANNSILLAIGTNPSAGTLTATNPVAAINGIATFSDLSIDAAGTGYTLIATSGSLTAATSTAFNLNSKVPTLSALPTTCITEGAGDFVLTVTGTNFEKNSSVRVNGINKSTIYDSQTQLRVTIPASDLVTAGNLNIDVLNPAPPANNISNVQVLNIKPLFSNATINGERIVCAGKDVVYTAPSGYTEYSWSTSAGAGVLVPTANPAIVRFAPSAPMSGTVTITVSAKNSCGVSGQVSFDVDVLPTPIAAISYDGTPEVCAGSSKVLSATPQPAGESYTYAWLKDGLAVGNSQPTLEVTEAGFYSVTITGINGCPRTSDAVEIKVNSLPVATIQAGGPITFCQGGSVTLTAQGGVSWLWNTGATTQSIDVSTAGNYTVQVTDANGCTSLTSKPTTVTVNPLPVARIQAGSPTTFCQGGSVRLTAQGGTSYLWSNGATTESIDVSASGTFTVKVTDANSCTSADSEPLTVTVNPLPAVTADNKSVCFGNNTVALTGSPAGGTWSGTGVSGSTFSANGLAAGDYTVTYTYTNANNCTQSATATVTVNPLPIATINPSGPITFCQGGSVRLTAQGGTSYLWSNGATTESIDVSASGTFTVKVTDANSCTSADSEPLTVTVNPLPAVTADNKSVCFGNNTVALTGSPAGGTWSGTGVSGSTFSANGLAAGDYTVTYTYTNANNCTQSATATVTVNPLPTISITPTGPLKFCDDKSVTLVANVSSNVAVSSYNWFKVGTTGSIFDGKDYTADESGDYYLVVTNQNGCEQTSQTLSVVVVEKPFSATVTLNGSTTFCSGGSVTLSANKAPAGQTYSYEWFKDNTSVVGTEADLTVSAAGDYKVVITNELEDCSLTSDNIGVTVLSQPTALVTSGSETKCIGTGNTTTFSIAGDFSGGNAQWISSNGNFVISNASYNTATGKATATVTATGTGTAGVTLRTTNTTAACNTASSSITLTVNPLPSAVITTTTPTTFCTGGSVVLSAPVGNNSYQWFNGASAIPNATDQQYTATTAGNYTVRVTDNTTTCVATTATATTVTVNPQPVVSSASANPAAKCVGEGNITSFSLTGAVANGNPSWSVVGATGGASVSNISSPNTLSTDVTVAGVGTVTMRLTSSSNVASCNDATRDVTLTVHPYPIANAGPDLELCSTGSTTIFRPDASNNTGTVDWTLKSGNATIGFPGNTVPTVYVNSPGVVVLTMTVTSNGCVSTDEVTLTAKPNPTVNAVSDLTYCNGASSAAINFGSSISGSTYSWTSSRDIGFGVSGDGNIPAFTAENTGTAPVTATINVRATAADCQGPQQSFTIKVNPTPTVSSSATANTCSEATFTYTPTSATAGTTYTWTRAAAGGNAAASGDGVISETLTNTTTAPITVTYVITPSANDCAGTPQNIVVTINPRPVLSSPLTATVCSGTAFTYTPASATPGTLTFRWTRAAVPGISNAAVTSAQTGGINETLVNATTAPIDVTYVYTTSANGCTGDPQNLVVTVNPRPVLSSTLTPAAICSGTTFNYKPTSETDNAGFSWTRLAATGINNGASTNGTGEVNEALTNSTANPINVTYRFTTSANNCSGTSTQDVVVRVNPTPTLSSTLTPAAVCSESAFNYTPNSLTLGASYTWTRAFVSGISNPAVTTPQSGGISETLVNSTTTDKTVVYVYTITANGCSNTQNVSVVVKPKPTPSFTGVTEGQVFYSGDGNVTLTGNYTSGGTFSGPGVSGTTFIPCNALSSGVNTATVPITYTVTINGCSTSVTKTVTVKRSTYTVVVTAVPFPFCRGDNVTYTAKVYRDVQSIVYPYLVDSQGRPIYDTNPVTYVPSGSGNFPVPNDKPVSEGGYPFPPNTPEIIKKMAYRYFEPKVTGGTLVDPALFDYQWHKNEVNERKNDQYISTDAGLSSMDYYGVYVTSKNSNSCIPTLSSQISDRKYSAEMETFSSTLTANPICKEGTITFTATLNSNFPYWNIAGLSMDLVRTRGGLVIGTATYNGSNSYSFNVNVPGVDLVNGDEVYVRFSSIIDDYRVNSKCAGRPSSNVVKVQIDQPATITANLNAAGQTVCAGGTASYTVTATGTNLQFTWFKEGSTTPIVNGGQFAITGGTSGGATTSTLTISNVDASNGGKYFVRVSNNTTTTACTAVINSAIVPLTVNPLPLVRTVVGGEYCPLNASGAEVTLQNSESGVNYTLLRGTTTLTTVAGNGGTISFGTHPAGTYNISALSGSGCSTASVGTATITETTVPVVTAELQITWINDKTQWEVVALSDHADKAGLTYEWYIGQDQTTPARITSTNTIIIDNPAADLFVKCVIKTPSGRCVPDVAADNTNITPLPVEIIYLTAQKQDYNVLLEWATAMERDNAGFEVQVSQDGHTYRKLDFVNSKNGNSSQKQVYKYIDKENGKYGTRYYRLKQTDHSGQVEYFGPKAVEFGSMSNKVMVYPNPFRDKVEVSIEAEQDGTMEIILSNSIGKQLIQKTVQVEKGLNVEQLLLDSSLPQGVYFVTTRIGSVTNHFKLLKN